MTLEQWRAIATLLRRGEDIKLVPAAGGCLQLVVRGWHPSDSTKYVHLIALSDLFAAYDPVGIVSTELERIREVMKS